MSSLTGFFKRNGLSFFIRKELKKKCKKKISKTKKSYKSLQNITEKNLK